MRRIVDLSLTLRAGMRGVEFQVARDLRTDGWNARTLVLYSHAGTHMDAPRHFIDGGETIDHTPLEACMGPARVVDLSHVRPRELITVAHLAPWADRIGAGDRLLLRTDWHRHADLPDYRTHFPRVSLELARWLVEAKVALLGVEPPSVADVQNPQELTAVHRVLLEGGVVIVEGLAHLDALKREVVEFIALPLKIDAGDGTPVRAVAVEED